MSFNAPLSFLQFLSWPCYVGSAPWIKEGAKTEGRPRCMKGSDITRTDCFVWFVCSRNRGVMLRVLRGCG